MSRKPFVLLVLMAMVAAGCAAETYYTKPSAVKRTDGTALEVTGVVTKVPFSRDIVTQVGRDCLVAKEDEQGNVLKTEKCKDNFVKSGDGPNIGQVLTDSVIDAAAVVVGAHVLGASMPKPGSTTVHGSSATGGTSKASSGAQSTGALTGSGSSATITVQNP